MKKIFHIVSNNEWGGGEQYVYDLSRRQMADGISIELFCRPVESVMEKFKELGVPVHPLSLHGALDMSSALGMAAVIRKASGSTIHAHNFKDAFTAAYARKLAGRKDVRVVMCRHLTRQGKNTLLYRWLYGQLDKICFDSEISLYEFLRTRPDVDRKKLCIVHTSIVLPEQVDAVDVRKEFDIPEHTVVMMYHGRLDQEKGLDCLLNAAAQLKEKDFRLVMVGRGSDAYTAHLHELVAEYGLAEKVVFAGFRHPILPYVAGADFGILPSIVREGCPLSPQEYMSQGHPVVTTDNGGQREYVVDGWNGLLVKAGDCKQLVDALGKLIDDADLRSRLGVQAKTDYVEKLNYEHFYQLIKNIYDAD